MVKLSNERSVSMFTTDFINYLVHFHSDRDYFECHEILEEHWKDVDARNKESILVGWIQLAVSQYHHRRGNFAGALRTIQKALSILTVHKQSIKEYGIDEDKLLEAILRKKEEIERTLPYKSMHLPINDASLLSACERQAEKAGLIWGVNSNLTNSEIIHRHSMRDRSEVIKSRLHALKQKKGSSD
jgi:uncharacterized protein